MIRLVAVSLMDLVPDHLLGHDVDEVCNCFHCDFLTVLYCNIISYSLCNLCFVLYAEQDVIIRC